MEKGSEQRGPQRTLSPQAALVYYHKLYQEQPLQFVQFYVASAPFRNAVHASGLCIVYPSDSSGPALVRLPDPPPSFEASERDVTNPLGPISASLGEQAPGFLFPQYPSERQHQQTMDARNADGNRARQYQPSTGFNGWGITATIRHDADTGRSAQGNPNGEASVGIVQLGASASKEPLTPSVQQLFDSVAAAQRQGIVASRSEAIGDGAVAQQSRHLHHQHYELEPLLSAEREHQGHQGTLNISSHRSRHRWSQSRARNGAQPQEPTTAPSPSCPAEVVGQLTDQMNALFKQQLKPADQGVDARASSNKVMERRRAQGGAPAADNKLLAKHRPNVPGMTKPARVSRRTLEQIARSRDGSELSHEQLNQVDREAWYTFDQIRPEDGENQRRARLLAHMNKVVRSEWPNACIRMFGSGANGLNMPNGDVDMCLVVPPQFARQRRPDRDQGIRQSREKRPYREQTTPLTDKQIMRRMAGMLRRSKMTNVQELLRARVPIIKVSDPVSGFQIDLCLNNELVHHNTDLLRSYVGLDHRIRPLALLVKYWAKLRCVNETYRGTLSSYAYVLLLINYLQIQEPPVLPCLQRMLNGRAAAEKDNLPVQLMESPEGAVCNVYYDRSVKLFDSGNKETLGKLLAGFFRYYAIEFDYSSSVVCTRLGIVMTRESKKWDKARVAELTERAEAEAEAEARADDELARLRRKEHANASAPSSVEFDESDIPSFDRNRTVGAPKSAGANQHRVGALPESLKAENVVTTPDERSTHRERLSYGDNPGSDGQTDDVLSTSKLDDDIDVEVRRERYLKRKLRMIEQHQICIEDPFELAHDIGRSVDAETLVVIRQEFVRAHDMLMTTGNLQSVLKEWESS
jgi:DNA polymerase sigma